MLLGNKSDLETIPEAEQQDLKIYEGTDAYAHLLMYVSGLLSRTPGESQIVSQFKEAYAELQDRAPETASGLQRLFQDILRDNTLVRNHFTSSLKPAFYEACAHELSEQGPKESVLVVANTGKDGRKPDPITEHIVRYLGNNRRDAAEKIIFTHPDDESLSAIHTFFLKNKLKGRISSEIETVPFDEVFDCLDRLQDIQRVFVCYPMGRNEDADVKMIQEWGQKEALGGKLIHLGGDSNAERQTRGKWENTDLELYVSPEEITEWQKTRKVQNADTIKTGALACLTIANCRATGGKPNVQTVNARLEQFEPLEIE